MSYLARIAACNQYDLSHFLPLNIGTQRYGWIKPKTADLLLEFPQCFIAQGNGIALHPQLQDYASRTRAVDAVVHALAARGVITGWRNERYPVTLDLAAHAVMEIERAAVPLLGLRAFGVHINGLVERKDGLFLWVARRAADKPTFPGMLDHIAAGGQPVGLSLRENVTKECAEEAGIPEAMAAQAQLIRSVRYCVETPNTLKPDTIYIYDLWLPEDFVPRNTDGEVADFELWPLDRVAREVAQTTHFKPNCNLVIIDLLLRQDRLPVDAQTRQEIQAALDHPLP